LGLKPFVWVELIGTAVGFERTRKAVKADRDDIEIVSMPCEIFVELGLTIKKPSSFKHTLIA